MAGNNKFFYRPAVDQVFLNNAFQNIRCAVPIPDAFGVNQSNRALHANLQAVRFTAVYAALVGEFQLSESFFQVIP